MKALSLGTLLPSRNRPADEFGTTTSELKRLTSRAMLYDVLAVAIVLSLLGIMVVFALHFRTHHA